MRRLTMTTRTLAVILCVMAAACLGQRTTAPADRTDASRPKTRKETTRVQKSVSQDAAEEHQQSPAALKAAACQRNLNRRVQTLSRRVAVVKREMEARQKREREKAVKRVPNPEAVRVTDEFRDAVRKAIAMLNNDPDVLSATISRRMAVDETTGGLVAQSVPIVTVNRQNWRAVLALAEQQCSVASRGKWVVPDDIQDRHKRETQQYEELESGDLTKAKALAREAGQALQAAADRPGSLDAKIAQWESSVDLAVAQAYDAIEELRTGRSSTAPARPIGYLIAPPTQEKSGPGHTQTLVVVMVIRSESFVPTEEVYQGLLQKHQGLPSMEDRQRVWVVDPRQFKMVLRGGQAVPAQGLFRSETCGGDILVNEEGRCILRYGADCPPRVSIRLAWELDPKDCAGRLQLQFADSEAVEVPACSLDPGVSESTGVDP